MQSQFMNAYWKESTLIATIMMLFVISKLHFFNSFNGYLRQKKEEEGTMHMTEC